MEGITFVKKGKDQDKEKDDDFVKAGDDHSSSGIKNRSSGTAATGGVRFNSLKESLSEKKLRLIRDEA